MDRNQKNKLIGFLKIQLSLFDTFKLMEIKLNNQQNLIHDNIIDIVSELEKDESDLDKIRDLVEINERLSESF